MSDTIRPGSILVLSQRPDLHSVRRLLRAAKRRRLPVRTIDPVVFVCRVDSEHTGTWYCGQPVPRSVGVIPRVGFNLPEYGWLVLRTFEAAGSSVLNPADGIRRAQDKFLSLQELGRAGVAVPRTFCTRSTRSVDEAIEFCSGLPLIVKNMRGAQGIGVIYVDSRKTLRSLLEAICSLGRNVLIQQYVPEAAHGDIRALVLEDQVIGAISRVTSPDEFRSNIHKGAAPESVVLVAEERELCLRAARVFGLRLAGVDFVRTEQGSVVLEVNPNPGFEGFERATGIDVAARIVDVVRDMMRKT
jgi:ribosomal protein S6--L-glutamate ligase